MRKKLIKTVVMIALSLTCMMGATGITAYANVDEAEVQAAEQQEGAEPIIPETETPAAETPTEETAPEEGRVQGDAFSVPGNAEVLDDITDGSSKEFFTIQTKNNNTFYLVVDRSQNSQNVYMLSAIDESDLEKFLDETQKESEKETEAQIVIPEKTETETIEPEKTQESRTGSLATIIFVVVLVGGAGAAYYFFKVKPGKEEEDVVSENLEMGDGLETENEDEEEE